MSGRDIDANVGSKSKNAVDRGTTIKDIAVPLRALHRRDGKVKGCVGALQERLQCVRGLKQGY